MKVEELYDEMGTNDSHLAHLQQADNEDYEVVAEDGDFGYQQQIRSVKWNHEEKKMVLELG